MKYDDASWHFGGNFPQDLAPEAGATHIGMFVVWNMLNGLAGQIHIEDFPDDIAKLENRELTPGAWFLSACDGKFTDEDLNKLGNVFARTYYASEDGLKTSAPSFLADYEASFAEFGDPYRIPDTWETYHRIAPIISRQFTKWRNAHPNPD